MCGQDPIVAFLCGAILMAFVAVVITFFAD